MHHKAQQDEVVFFYNLDRLEVGHALDVGEKVSPDFQTRLVSIFKTFL
jgi:hypothetical protein